MINLFARINSNINELINQNEQNNMIYIKNNIFNSESNYDEYYLGYGQHINHVCKPKIFRPIYCKFLPILLPFENIIMKNLTFLFLIPIKFLLV